MTLRDEARRHHPDFPWLDAGDHEGVECLMRELGWLSAGESVHGCDPAGDGNMNLADAITVLDYLFQSGDPDCIVALDYNDNEVISLAVATGIL